ncbi:sodium-dependent transporter [Reichenbachiella sp. MALMAid0571]|uniref:sodium-dependent transporter n=1 Tax=Reichenbachiella sp. MALMAid0571 TaxID=3143939 RepID=UPI0032E04EDD
MLSYLLILVCAVALNMENGVKGLEYMFSIDTNLFTQPNIWIEAVSQSAWSTGAGWGLLITLSSYSNKNEDVTLNTFVGAFGNNTASLLAGMAILPAVFALSALEGDAISYLQSGNQALVFTIIPRLFANIYGGDILSSVFFLALFLAAFSSLLPMIELFISHVVRTGLSRKKSILLVIIVFVIAGFPSVYSLDFFTNQDWVWGIGLILSGLFIAFAVVKYGIVKFKTDLIDKDSDFRVSLKYFFVCIVANLLIGIILIYWWLSRGYSTYPWFGENGHWNLFDVYSNSTVLTQWGVVLFVGFLLNRLLYKKIVRAV